MSAPADVLELLLPDAPPEVAARARRLTTFLRLLASDARPPLAGTVRVNLQRARSELERDRSARLERAHRELLAHHLAEALGPESFARPPEPAEDAAACWRVLADAGGDVRGLPELPAPGEPAARVAARVIAAARALDLLAGELPFWDALQQRADAGPEQGARAFREALAGGGAKAPELVLAGLAACLLDRGDARAAALLLGEHERDLGTRQLLRLRSWVRLVLGEDPGDPLAGAEIRLPLALVELRRRRQEWLPWLAGRAPLDRRGPQDPSAPRVRSRRDVGASVLGVFALRAGGVAHALHLDVGAGLADRAQRWLERRAGACGEPGEPEHRLLVRARTVIEHRRDRPLRGALGAERAAALALVPVPDGGGEVAGWLHVEAEHHLLPCEARLERAALGWRADVLEARDRVERGPGWNVRAEPEADGEPCARFFRGLFERLEMKTAQRSWWGFVSTPEGLRPAARGGGRPHRRAADEARGEARALDRALVSGGVVRYEGPDARVSISRDAMSGVVVPVRSRGELIGLVCVESGRRRDLGDAPVRRLVERVDSAADSLRAALFREWHLRRFGHDVHVPSHGPLFEDVLAAARASAALALTGPPGSGKDLVARWVHHESRRSGPLDAHVCAHLSPERGLPAGASGGTLLLQDLAALDPRLQSELLRRLDAGSSARMLLTLERSPSETAAEGRLAPVLARRLERLQLRVPPLSERREEIPALVAALLARFAFEEGLPTPRIEDDAMAALWRQPWPGNVRELENLVYRIVVTRAGGELGVAQLEGLARRAGLELVCRVPSRSPDPELVRAALRSTRTQRGSLNKTRAAAYLGWDPDTLVARMRELGLDASVLAT